MKRSTAIRHLIEIGDEASARLHLRTTAIGWPLDKIWAGGAFLDSVDEFDHGQVVLRLGLPVRELPWLAAHPAGEWIGDQLRLGKRPMLWTYRPTEWPAWNCRARRVVRFWSAANGTDADAVDALRQRSHVHVDEPGHEEFAAQLTMELELAMRHLRATVDRYWDRDWRDENRGYTTPEDQLWRAAAAISELDAALNSSGE